MKRERSNTSLGIIIENMKKRLKLPSKTLSRPTSLLESLTNRTFTTTVNTVLARISWKFSSISMIPTLILVLAKVLSMTSKPASRLTLTKNGQIEKAKF